MTLSTSYIVISAPTTYYLSMIIQAWLNVFSLIMIMLSPSGPGECSRLRTVLAQFVLFLFLVLKISSSCIFTTSQGTPPFMALEIMLQSGKDFCHNLRHDLESLLYVIIWMCNHMLAPGVERMNEDRQRLHIRKWCDMEKTLQHLGHTKLAHIVDAERIIFEDFTPYWEDFKPFVRNLLVKFFPSSPAHPNKITPEDMLAILNEARSVVKEPHAPRDSILSDHPSESVTRRYATLVGTKQDRLGQDSVSIPKQLEQDISKQLKQDNAPRFVSTLSQLESLGPPSL
jgi:hypothetical protein